MISVSDLYIEVVILAVEATEEIVDLFVADEILAGLTEDVEVP